MKTSAPAKTRQTNHTTAAIGDLAPKSGTDVRGGVLRESAAPAVSEIVVTKTQDCSSTGL